MRVVGLDLSITATGIAGIAGVTYTVQTRLKGDHRLLAIRKAVADLTADCDLAAIEDLPTHAHGAGVTGMVHGVVRELLLARGVPYVLITPAGVKKYATGKGSCGKPEMAVAAFKRAGVEFGDDNQCDAWWLRAMTLDHLGQPVVTVPESHRVALKPVAWPVLIGE